VISCPPLKIDKGSFVEMLQRSAGEWPADAGDRSMVVGRGTIEVQRVRERREAPRRPEENATRSAAPLDRSGFLSQWEERSRRYEVAQHKPLFVSPTALKERDTALPERFEQKLPSVGETDPLLIGTLAHGFLEELDFSTRPETFEEELASYVKRQPDRLLGPDPAGILQELRQIFQIFFRSSVFAELASATILGREIPLLIPSGGQVMEGVIDLLYERDGSLYIADYKTDRTVPEDWARVSGPYRRQGEIYSLAVRQSLQREIKAFKLIFLRAGKAIELEIDAPQGELFLL
ncbi:MAG TPA: PD-(D/E)XK nuclease family protein, partial [Candidatus Binatia bacterium]|nr:PD-(D/E)XK nuclease family protein [Candidatus Binatia bacterium]